jgi:acyl-CoA synthetase (AMP-forming)/AMP-acid ligase II
MYWFINNRGRKVRRSTQEDILEEAEALAKALRDAGGLGPRSDDRIRVYKGRVLAFIVHGRSGHVEGHDLQGASQFVG